MENELQKPIQQVAGKPKKDWGIFLSSVFFVLGFSVVFSLLGVLLQTVLVHVSLEVSVWLDRIGGIVIILFGLFLLDLIHPAFLMKERKVVVKKRFGSYYITSFIFGAAFAVGWTPCVGAALGAILALAATQPGSAFFLLFAYTMGIGVPFLLVGLFFNQAKVLIKKASKWLRYFQYVFGALLVVMGIFIFVGELSAIGNFQFLTMVLDNLGATGNFGGGISSLNIISFVVAFAAGLASFLSPCILPIVPGFLSYLASTTIKKEM